MRMSKVKFIRLEKNISRAELSRISGVPVSTLIDIENNGANARFDTMSRIADALGVLLDELRKDKKD